MLVDGMTWFAYWASLAVGALVCAGLCVWARRAPDHQVHIAGRVLALVLMADAVTFVTAPLVQGRWRVGTSLPLALCDVALVVAAAACWWRQQTLVELTYFWGLAGTLQALITPDLTSGFPHLTFVEFVVGHVGVVTAALLLVVGMRLAPRPGAVGRVFAITVGYTAVVGVVDWMLDVNYMFLRAPPEQWSLLSVLGPWPWYLCSAAALALVLLVALDAPFHRQRRAHTGPAKGREVARRTRPWPGRSA